MPRGPQGEHLSSMLEGASPEASEEIRKGWEPCPVSFALDFYPGYKALHNSDASMASPGMRGNEKLNHVA